MEPDAVAAVVPVWDHYADELLHEALDSLFAQDGLSEVIVVDNASRQAVRTDDERVTVVRSPQRVSTGAARNLGLARVRAPLVLMWDADDVMLPGTLATLRATMAADRDLVAAAAAIHEARDGVRHRWPRRWISWLVRHPRLLAVINSVWSQFPTTGATLMRTDVVRAAGGYAVADAAEDWSLGTALLWRGRVAWTERPGRVYRRSHGSLWSRQNHTRRLLGHARAVRSRLREDPSVPRWFARALPVVAAAQYFALLVVQPLVRLGRGGRCA
jgi:glycosyltransferase involved in cell wall biosynthesis